MKHLIILAIFLGGCAFVNLETPDVKLTSLTVMKDISYDPNSGAASVTSPKAENIVTAIGSFFAGWLIGK
jgi:hypothetical protein